MYSAAPLGSGQRTGSQTAGRRPREGANGDADDRLARFCGGRDHSL